jgi:hypothetical protein
VQRSLHGNKKGVFTALINFTESFAENDELRNSKRDVLWHIDVVGRGTRDKFFVGHGYRA